MVGSGVDGAHAVGTGWQATSDGRAQDTIDCLRVETLEERKLLGIKDSGVAQPIDGLNDHVGVTDDLAIAIGLLGSTKVVSVGVDEGAGLNVLDSHFNGKVLVRGDGVEVLRRGERGGRHLCFPCNDAHDDGIAAAISGLETIGDRHVHRSAEIDEVILASERSDLAGFVVSTGKTVLGNVGPNLRLVEREGRLAA